MSISDQTFQAFAYITLANMPLAKPTHIATNEFKQQGNTHQPPLGPGSRVEEYLLKESEE